MTIRPIPIRISPTQSTAVEISYVPTERVGAFWPDVERQIERAMEHSGGVYKASDIRKSLEAGEMLLWLISLQGQLIASAVTEVDNYPQRSALVVVCVGGSEFWRWIRPFIGALERYQAQLGVDCVRAACRDGMAKWLSQLGWRRVLTLMEM